MQMTGGLGTCTQETVLNASLRSQRAHNRAGTNMGAVYLYIIRTELNSRMRPG